MGEFKNQVSVLANLAQSLSLAAAENCSPPSLLPVDLDKDFDKDLDKDLVPFMVCLSSNLTSKESPRQRTRFFFLLLSLMRLET